MTRPLFVGVDGGQSQLRLRDSASDRETIVPGIAHLEGDVTELTALAVARAWEESRLLGERRPIERIVLGLTTLPTAAVDRQRLARRIGGLLPAAEVWLTGDAVIAHAGALPERNGIVLVVGTGIACLAADSARGSAVRADGDGFLLGDAGASFWIGRRGIAAVLRAADGRGEHTALTAAAAETFGEWDDLAAHVHGLVRPVDRIAQFARVVQSRAEEGDAVAGGIVRDAAAELLLTALAAAKSVGTRPAPLAILGRTAQPGTPLRARLAELLADETRLREVTPAGGALEGALALASSTGVEPYGSHLSQWKRES